MMLIPERPGACRLCGETSGVLSLEHIPPKSSGNRGRGEIEYFSLGDQRGVVRTDLSDGVALKVLCEDCNNRFGSRLGTTFSDFAVQVRSSGRFEVPGGGAFVAAVEIYPSRIVRQLLLTYICAHPVDDRTGWDDLREYIKSRSGSLPDTAPRLALYFNPADTYRIVPTCSVGTIDGTRRQWAGAEIAVPGLGVLFSLVSHDGATRLIGKRPVDISEWGAVPFDKRESLSLKLPRLRVEAPHPLGFGTRRDVDRWQSRNAVVWGVAEAQYPESPLAIGAVWRVHRPRRKYA